MLELFLIQLDDTEVTRNVMRSSANAEGGSPGDESNDPVSAFGPLRLNFDEEIFYLVDLGARLGEFGFILLKLSL